ncbi:DUF4123 domain-containing protein [Marinobacter manganoxydans]|jgi:uncharacterized protein DUF4123|uniref:DUF4123 domain-containing protein n=1 Tax=Marinobacter manganoxydans MnI7-9 TaxID=1094979 RepID=G6YP97_9GAMM|nr:DUF4123 domain-containing protein [Marinobacter manganoxydans]EHJ05872.1 hypothetical protein KYE_03505 [Marinobacter manganoxydans MnI7-9]MBI46380.1 DUF4123 domain-containing protein [Marinobacter sp.]MCP4065690.1 DUF4123 domain-containing protein [Gammaproteobacteria bacterium]PTB82395.1 DUF4123 domain-containing protein [Marinobacter sp. Z-D5-3]|tara:strand:+ start:590 stop:1414 length:825 start_codon:yes stop_codon:yes gene_type:complete
MNQDSWSLRESPFTHVPWPGHQPVGLVLDGVAIPELGEQIYQWAGGQTINAECLYVATRWEAVSDLSPWLVWLSGPEDPVLEGFLEQGPRQEQGYLLISATDHASCACWMRSHLQVEVAPGCEELVRIAHPALAATVIGGNLPRFPTRAVDRLIVPDCISEQWHLVEPPAVQSGDIGDQPEKMMASRDLKGAFDAFNRRKGALHIWNNLHESVRNQLGGPDLRDAYPALGRILEEALGNGCNNLREVMQFLFVTLPPQADSNAVTETAPPLNQG